MTTITTLNLKFDRDEISSIEYVHGVTNVYRNLSTEVGDENARLADQIEMCMFLYNDDPYQQHPFLTPDMESIDEFALCLQVMLHNHACEQSVLLAELGELYGQEIDRLF